MFRNYLDKIERDEDVRKNLIELRKLLKIEPAVQPGSVIARDACL